MDSGDDCTTMRMDLKMLNCILRVKVEKVMSCIFHHNPKKREYVRECVCVRERARERASEHSSFILVTV